VPGVPWSQLYDLKQKSGARRESTLTAYESELPRAFAVSAEASRTTASEGQYVARGRGAAGAGPVTRYNPLAMTAPGAPHRSDAADPHAGARPLMIVLVCPQCGAPSTVDGDAVSLTCAHCQSFLVVAHPDRQPAFTCDRTVPDADEARAIVIQYRVQAYRAEVIEVPKLILDGGPEVDAIRATVYQPR
jgi:hypothetical protein